MIQPSALPAASATAPTMAIPMAAGIAGEAGEVVAGFAALLGIQLDTAASTETPAQPLTDLPIAAAAQAIVAPDGKALPDPLQPAADDEELPEAAEGNELEPAPTVLPAVQLAPPIA